jgi:dTDP-4-amino-4,6-dideoxygalactose transaminase
MDKLIRYKNEIAAILNSSEEKRIYLYWKGRVALYALLKAMGVGDGDEVILPGFTCVVVPNAIKYTGAKPVYVDVDMKTMNPSLDNFKKAVTGKTKVIIVQNTFGLSTQVDEIAMFAKAHQIFTIEDCTHGFGGSFKGKPNGSWCDVAFFSTQWNKPFSTGIGGFAAINNLIIIPELERINKKLINPSFKDKIILSSLLFAADHILNPKTYWKLRSMYRFLSKYNLVIGSSQGNELNSTQIPVGFFKGISDVQIKKGITNLKTFKELFTRRKTNALRYTEFLQQHNKYHVSKDIHEDHSFLKYPVLVKDRAKFDELAIQAKIQLGDWFCTPIYPVKENWERWDLDATTIPNAVYLSQHIQNLPTETNDPVAVLKFLEQNMNELL